MLVKLDRVTTKIGQDKRFRSWAKLVTDPSHIDLSKTNGYALTGPWAKFGDTIALKPGEFIVAAAEVGSVRTHPYDYSLITTDGENIITLDYRADSEAIAEVVKQAPEELQAKAANNTLYRFSVYCSVKLGAI